MKKRLLYLLGHVEEYLIAVCLCLMVVVVFLATFGRYTGAFSMPWGDELGRYLCVWVVFLGIAAGAKVNAHFIVDVVPNMLPDKYKPHQRLFSTVFVTFFLGVLIYYSSLMCLRIYRMNQLSASLRIPIWTIYIAIPFGLLLMAVRTIQFTVTWWKARTEPDKDIVE